MLEKLAENEREYVSLDNPITRQLTIEEPDLFLQRYTPLAIIDEIQYAPDLLPVSKDVWAVPMSLI